MRVVYQTFFFHTTFFIQKERWTQAQPLSIIDASIYNVINEFLKVQYFLFSSSLKLRVYVCKAQSQRCVSFNRRVHHVLQELSSFFVSTTYNQRCKVTCARYQKINKSIIYIQDKQPCARSLCPNGTKLSEACYFTSRATVLYIYSLMERDDAFNVDFERCSSLHNIIYLRRWVSVCM